MAIVLILFYGVVFWGLWLFLRVILKALLKDKFKQSHLILAFLIVLPFAIIALGFLALALIPIET